MSLRQVLSILTGIGILLILNNCRQPQPEMPRALSNKHGIVIKWGAEQNGLSTSMADSLLGELFPALQADFDLLATYRLTEGREWLVGLQYVQDQGWLPTFAGSWRGQQTLAERYPALSASAYSTFRGVTLFQLQQNLFGATTHGFLILGRIPLLVEDAIRELDGGIANLGQDVDFRRQWKKKTATGRRIFLRPAEFSPLWSGPIWLTSWLNDYKWVDITLQTVDGKLAFSGSLLPKDTQKSESLPRQKETQLLPPFLPENINRLHWTNASILTLPDPYLRFFQEWWDGEITTFQFEGQRYPVFAFKSTDVQQAQDDLDALANQQGILVEEDYQVFLIRQLLDDQLLEQWYPIGVRNPYYALIGDYVVFSASRSALTVCIDYYLAGRPSAHLPALFETLNGKATHYNYFRPEALFASKYWPSEVAWTEMPMGDERRLSGLGQSTAQPDHTLSLGWKYPLNGEIIAGPAAIRSADGQIYAYLVQDEKGRLYCLDIDGQLLWLKQLDGPVISDFKTWRGRSQNFVFFNSASQVYALDFMGNFLSNFPIDLPVPAKAGLQVVDFDRIGQASLFISTTDGSIYGFDQEGKRLPGWGPLRDTLPLRFPLVHLQENFQDLLLGINEADSVLIWNRAGEKVLIGWQMDTLSLSPPQLSQRRPQKIMVIDVTGKGEAVSNSGTRTSFHFPRKSHRDVRWLYTDISGDENKEFILSSDLELSAYSGLESPGKLIFTYTFPYPPDLVFSISESTEAKSLLGALNLQRRKLYALDGAGRLLPGFPVAADRPAVLITKPNNHFVIVTGLGRDVVAYGK